MVVASSPKRKSDTKSFKPYFWACLTFVLLFYSSSLFRSSGGSKDLKKKENKFQENRKSVALVEAAEGNNEENHKSGAKGESKSLDGRPPCQEHVKECSGLCSEVGNFVKKKREQHLSSGRVWALYYPAVSAYYKCTNAKVVVEVGAAFGGQTAYHLKNSQIEEYHVVDPFMAGYDPNDMMSQLIRKAAPNASPEDISLAWAAAMSKHLGNDGSYAYTKQGESITMPPAGCRLRIHRMKSEEGAALFADQSVDLVFIDGLHTYEGVVNDIQAWKNKIKVGGSLVFNDYFDLKMFPGVSKAVHEYSKSVYSIDRFNAVVGPQAPNCTLGPVQMDENGLPRTP